MNKVIKLKPCVKSYIWGGHFFQKYGKSNLDIVSELWELSVRDGSSSIIASGKNEGKNLNEVISKQDIGENAAKFPYFPLLIKLIDAEKDLSVQVHPSDEYALKKESSFGKSEMWHIIDSEKGCVIYLGLNNDYSKEKIEQKLKNNSILDVLNFFEVKKGETYMINPGTIHAIGKGVKLIEIQQNSDLTYRLFDYLRKDVNGNYRELHIQKALEVIDFHKYSDIKQEGNILADNKYFHVERKEFDGELDIKANEGSFVSFTFIKGNGMVDDIPYQTFDTFFLPANKSCKVKGKGTVILSRV